MVDRDALIARAWAALTEQHRDSGLSLHELARQAIAVADAHPVDVESPLSARGPAEGWERGVASCVRAYAFCPPRPAKTRPRSKAAAA